MKKGIACLRDMLFGCMIILVSVLVTNDSVSDRKSHYSRNSSAVPGRFIVSFYQDAGEGNFFGMNNGEVRTTLGSNVRSRLDDYGLKRARKAIHRGNKAIYSFNFEPRGNDEEILNYLRTLPSVVHVQRDYRITFHFEPNDHYYQPDSLHPKNHWIPDTMNIMSPICNDDGGISRWCENEAPLYGYADCCPDEYYVCKSNWFRDSLHYSDNWYLQFTQANRAWDIQKGDPDVTIMVMDSGVDDEHPDLSANIWTNEDESEGDDWGNGLPGSSGDDDGDGYLNFSDLSYIALDLDKDGNNMWGADDTCDAGPDGDYGFGPNAIDDYPPGPFAVDGDDIPVLPGPGNDPWDDNLRGWGTPRAFDDDFDDVQFIRLDDDENGYPDDFHGANFFNPVEDWPEPGKEPDGLPGLKGWDDDVGGVDRDNDGIHFNDYDVRTADFDGDGIPLCGANDTCDAGPDGDYGFGPNAIDDYPPGPFGGDDDSVKAGPDNDPWDDNLRGWGTPREFDDDMDDVYFLKFDDEEDGNPLFLSRDDCCPKTTACHGTNMTGIISAVTNNSIGMAGYTWYCKIVPAKIAIGYPEHTHEDDSEGAVLAMCKAIDYAIDNRIDIINMSLGYGVESDLFPDLNAAFNKAYNAGIICIASAANNRTNWTDYPASHEHVIAVSGVHRTNTWANNTTWDELVDICAPVSVWGMEAYTDTILPGDTDTTTIRDRGTDCVVTSYYSSPHPIFNWDDPPPPLPHAYGVTALRTSGAAAQASGLAGLLVSQYPRDQYGGYTSQYVDFIKGEILRGAVPIDDDLYDQGLLGAGYINAYRSLTRWGRVRNDTIWTNFAYISADMRVDEGVTLTIQPGTIIHVAPDDNDDFGVDPDRIVLEVYGTLNINGAAGQPVEFKSLAENPQPGDWYGIWYKGVNSSGTVSHCKISDARYGIKSKKTITVRDCEIKNCLISGIYVYEADGTSNSSLISNCVIKENSSEEASGIQIWNCWDTVTVDSCNIIDNYRGIWLSNTVANIKSSEIDTSTTDGIWVTYYQCLLTTYPKIEWCRLQRNEENGIYFYYTSGEVSNTKIWDVGHHGIYCSGSESQPEIDHTKIFGRKMGVKAGLGALPVLGDINEEEGMNNAIYGNDLYEVYNADTATTIMAENCWWGTEEGQPPLTVHFYNSVDFIPYLESDPVSYLYPRARGRSNEIWLARNYPNPCNQSGTTIGYFIPAGREAVSLIIYDVLGRRIKTLANTVQGPGEYRIRWNGRNDSGVLVAPGVYFYKLSVGNKSQTKKLVFFR